MKNLDLELKHKGYKNKFEGPNNQKLKLDECTKTSQWSNIIDGMK